ncbi:MAG: helix-turn-helix transcriptional regulator [Lautropia sp.]
MNTSLPHRPADIDDLYEAALDPAGLERLAAAVMKAGGGSSAVVTVLHADEPVEAMTCGLPDEALQRYVAYYRRVHPIIPLVLARHRARIVRYSDLLSVREFRRTEFYTDFSRVVDTVHVMGMPQLSIGAGTAAEIGVHRGASRHDFSRRDIRRLEALVPHLQRALQLRRRLGPRLQTNVGLAALEAFAFGCIICDRSGRVRFANSAACALEADGRIALASSRHGFGAVDPAESRRLAALIGETAIGGSGGAMVLGTARGARLFVLVAPLPARFRGQPGEVLVTLRSESSAPPFDADGLRMLFGLTPAEARLALALAAGRSIAEIGAEHRVTENTLRTQIASVLRKTDTASQRELARILNLPPPLRGALDRQDLAYRRWADSTSADGR